MNGPLSGGSNGNDRLDKLSMDELEVHTWTANIDWHPSQAVYAARLHPYTACLNIWLPAVLHAAMQSTIHQAGKQLALR